ncbi:hypothetical protein GCK72_016285 [Caenorhabditis remanei]|uniref:Uncharacterized protein n=1 Tax=Caenorhabditis remanei TaxID=31234 RepID=A0A6A5GWD4_CAERE|nr:hypothetical protein GCK72_016285 [Caenorhabditis remanei]KAF1759818.1 hypothetical protein GCK72_016285 [Caenorhabditis remanei]
MITPDQIKEIYTQILEALRVVKIASMSGIWDLLEFDSWEILEGLQPKTMKQLWGLLAIYVVCSIAQGLYIEPTQIRKELFAMGMKPKYVEEYIALEAKSQKDQVTFENDPAKLREIKQANKKKLYKFMDNSPGQEMYWLDIWMEKNHRYNLF